MSSTAASAASWEVRSTSGRLEERRGGLWWAGCSCSESTAFVAGLLPRLLWGCWMATVASRRAARRAALTRHRLLPPSPVFGCFAWQRLWRLRCGVTLLHIWLPPWRDAAPAHGSIDDVCKRLSHDLCREARQDALHHRQAGRTASRHHRGPVPQHTKRATAGEPAACGMRTRDP